MRIKTQKDLEDNLQNKIFYVVQCNTDFSYENPYEQTIMEVKKLREDTGIFPCKLVKTTDKELSNYRMVGDRGEAFLSAHSNIYTFTSLDEQEAKKYKIPEYFFDYGLFTYIPRNKIEFNGLAVYEDLITNMSNEHYSSYTENRMVSYYEIFGHQKNSKYYMEEKSNDNHIEYGSPSFERTYAIFTDLQEAKVFFDNNIKHHIKASIKKINEAAESKKEKYYRVLYDSEKYARW